MTGQQPISNIAPVVGDSMQITSLPNRQWRLRNDCPTKGKIKIKPHKWGTDGGSSTISNVIGTADRVMPAKDGGQYEITDKGLFHVARSERRKTQIGRWVRARLECSSGDYAVMMLFNEATSLNPFLLDGALSETRSIESQGDQLEESGTPQEKVIRVHKVAPYKVQMGMIACDHARRDYRRESSPQAIAVKRQIRGASRPLPQQRIDRRRAIAVIEQSDIDLARSERLRQQAKERAATLKKAR